MSVVRVSPEIVEFYNSHHSKSDGRFTSGGSGSSGVSATKHSRSEASFKRERLGNAKTAGQSKASPDAPTYKGQAAVRRALSKASNEHGQSGGFEFTLKNGQRTEISVQKTTATHIYGKGGFGEYRIAFKDIVSAKPLGIASTTNTGQSAHAPLRKPTGPHIQMPVRKHTTPNFIDTNNVRHIKSLDDWTAKHPNGSRHPTGTTGHTKVKVKNTNLKG